MALTDKLEAQTQDVVAVKHHDGPILLPSTMRDKYGNTDFDPAIKALTQAKAHESQVVAFRATVDAFPWETSLALVAVLEEEFGAATMITKMGWFGPEHPEAVEVKVGPGKTKLIPWGAPFRIPGLDEVELSLTTGRENGRMTTIMTAEVKRRYEPVLKELAGKIRTWLLTNSIYKGQALKIGFDQQGNPEIDFLDLASFDDSRLNYTREVESIIEDSILTPIRYPELCEAAGIRKKRAALAAGPYGTGKTALMRKIMRVATLPLMGHARWTGVYLTDVSQLSLALPYVERWGRTVVCAEDLDKVASAGRDEMVQKMSTALDGLENYSSQVFVICTTNNLDNIHPVLRREGRFDVTIPVDLPDAEAVVRLLRAYGGSLISELADLSKASQILKGFPPATAEEVVQVAKLSYIRRQENTAFLLDGEDIYRAALQVQAQRRYSQKVDQTPSSKDELFGMELGRGLAQGMAEAFDRVLARGQETFETDDMESRLTGRSPRLVLGLPAGPLEASRD